MGTKEIQLEKIRIAASKYLSPLEFDFSHGPVNFACKMDCHKKNIVAMFNTYVLGEGPEPFIIEHPATWWQAFKERWYPKWLLTRWPVVYKHHDITFKILYPHYEVQLPKEEHVVKLLYRNWTELKNGNSE